MLTKLKGLNRARKWLAKEQRWEDYWYSWKKRRGVPRPTRLPGKPGSPEFLNAYYKALQDRKALEASADGVRPNTLAWFIEEKFSKSQHFKQMDEKTRYQYGWAIPSIENEFGDLPLGALKDRRTRAAVIEWRDSIADGTCETLMSRRPDRSRKASVAMADLHVAKFAAMLAWGVKTGWLESNPLTCIEKLHHSTRLDKVWSWNDEAKFLAGARPDLVEAYIEAVWTGFRESDCIDLRVSDYDGEFIRRELIKRPRPDKPRKRVIIPVGGPLKPILDAMVARTGAANAGAQTRAETKILRNSEGRPWASGKSFYNAFHDECVRLGIKDRTFHDIRRTAVVRLAIAGCTEPEIASITGHSIKDVKSILERHYLYLDPQIAINAMKKLENSFVHLYAQFVRQFMEAVAEPGHRRRSVERVQGFNSGTTGPTESPTASFGSPLVRKKA